MWNIFLDELNGKKREKKTLTFKCVYDARCYKIMLIVYLYRIICLYLMCSLYHCNIITITTPSACWDNRFFMNTKKKEKHIYIYIYNSFSAVLISYTIAIRLRPLLLLHVHKKCVYIEFFEIRGRRVNVYIDIFVLL